MAEPASASPGAASDQPPVPPPRRRPLLLAAIALALGIILGRHAGLPPWHGIALALAAAALEALLFRKLRPALQTLLILIIIGATGLTLESSHIANARRNAIAPIAGLPGKTSVLCTVTGTLSGEIDHAVMSPLIQTEPAPPPESLELSIFRVRIDHIETNGAPVPASGAVRVTVHGRLPSGIIHGDRLRVFGWLHPLNDTERYSISRGYAAQMSVDSPDAVRLQSEGPASLPRTLSRIKTALRSRIDQHAAALTAVSPQAPALLKAMLLGDREELRSDLADDFNQSGTTHILAISGLHLGIVYGALYWLCRMLLIRGWLRRTIILTLIIAYALITGLGPATTRAMLMIIMLETADSLRFYRDPLSTVAACALAILLLQPHYLFEAGFQLTFVAVLGILAFSKDITRLLVRRPDDLQRLEDMERPSKPRALRRKLWKTCAALLAVSAAASLAVAPIQAYYFDIVTPVSIIATAALVPVITLLIGGGFLFLAIGTWIPGLSTLLAWALSALAAAFSGVAQTASALPGGHLFTGPPPLPWILLFYASLLLVAARRRIRIRTTLALAAPVLIWAAYAVSRLMLTPGPDLAVTFINVNHGMSAVVTRGRDTILIDCGSGMPMSTYDVGRRTVARELRRQGIRRIDILILSHTDADHVNGVPSLAQRFPIGRVIINDTFKNDPLGRQILAALEQKAIPVHYAGAGDRLSIGNIDIQFLWPPNAPSGFRLRAVNDRSLVARVSSGGRSILFPGDIESPAIAGLLSTHASLESEILCLPHHGAEEPVLPQLMSAVRPAYAVISRSPGDPPLSSNVEETLRGTRVLTTSREGTIRLLAAPAGWRIDTDASR